MMHHINGQDYTDHMNDRVWDTIKVVRYSEPQLTDWTLK